MRKRTLLDFTRNFCHAQKMLEYFLILSISFCSFAILGTLPEWPWQWNESAKMHFCDLRPKFSELFSVALVAKENWEENAIIIQKWFVLQTLGQGHLFSFCRTGGQHAFSWFASKGFSRLFSVALVAKEYWAENAIIIQKGFVLQTWGQGHLFSFCRTGGQHAFSWFALKVF